MEKHINHLSPNWPVSLGRWLTAGLLLLGLALWVSQTAVTTGQETSDSLIYLPLLAKPAEPQPPAATATPEPENTPTPENTATPTPSPTPELDPAKLFVETFDGDPAAPEIWTDENWEITIHQRDNDRLYEMLPMQAQHGPNCEAPDATHTVTSHEANLYICKNHMMTANYGASDNGGYGMVYFTPNRTLDATGDWQVQFDLSTYRVNRVRNWVDIWLTPYDENLQLTLHNWLPDLQGTPPEAIQIRLDQDNSFLVYHHQNGDEIRIEPDEYSAIHENFEDYLTDPVRYMKLRSTFFFGVVDGRLKIGMPEHDMWWYDQPAPETLNALRWQQTVVQFGHHSYTPTKLCDFSYFPEACAAGNGADTFHWDNVLLYPATEFTLIHGSPRLITPSTMQTFTAQTPAPAGAYLRFGGIGDNLEVSFDEGATWQAAVEQAHTRAEDNEHFRSYWMPIPEGTSAVQFRGENWGNGDNEWAARDISIWSKQAPETDGGSDRLRSQLSAAEHDFFKSLISGKRSPESFMCDFNGPREKTVVSN